MRSMWYFKIRTKLYERLNYIIKQRIHFSFIRFVNDKSECRFTVENHTETMNQIVSLFAKFGIEVRPKRFSSNGIAGRYVVELLNGVRFSKIEALEDDFESHLNEQIRILKVNEASPN